MRLLPLVLLAVAMLGCKPTKEVASTSIITNTAVDSPGDKNDTPIKLTIDGKAWNATSYDVQQMGVFWVIKALGPDKSVFSIMLPDPLATADYIVSQGGPVSITYSNDPAHALTYLAPYSENNGWVKTKLNKRQLEVSLEVTLNSGGELKKCKGQFSVNLN